MQPGKKVELTEAAANRGGKLHRERKWGAGDGMGKARWGRTLLASQSFLPLSKGKLGEVGGA